MSNAIRCPKCPYYEKFYQAPLGKIVRNPYANTGKVVFDDCNACGGTGYVPLLILESIRKSFPNRYEEIVGKLRWATDHFSFDLNGIYCGIELDGYIHS